MNIIELKDRDVDTIIDYFISRSNRDNTMNVKPEDTWVAKVGAQLEDYGFLFNSFKIYANDYIFKVEIDKDCFYIRTINFDKNVHNKDIKLFVEWCQEVIDKKVTVKFENSFVFLFVLYVLDKAMNQEIKILEETKRRYTKSGERKNQIEKDYVYSLTQCIRKYAKHDLYRSK